MSHHVQVPFDVIITIIDQLHDDMITLQHCSLVSRLFITPARRYIFSDIEISSEALCLQFHDLLKSNPVIASHVRHLTLKIIPINDSYESEDQLWILEQYQTLTDILEILREHLCSFHYDGSLSYEHQSFIDFAPPLKSTLIRLFKSSNLTNVSLIDLNDFPIQLFATCLQLIQLKLRLSLIGCIRREESTAAHR